MSFAVRTLALILLPIGVIIGASAYLAVLFDNNATATRALAFQTRQVIDSGEAFYTALQDAESSQRGYIITGEARYLEPYGQGIETAKRGLDELERLVADDPDQAQRAASLRPPFNDKLDELAQTIALRQTQGFDAARAVVLSDRGKADMDAIRRILGELAAAESTVLASQRLEIAGYQRRVEIAASIAAGVAALTLLIGSLLLIRNLSQLRTAERAMATEAGLLRTTLDTTREGVLAFDDKNQLAAWNERAMTLFSLPASLARRGAVLADFAAAHKESGGPPLFEPPPADTNGQGLAASFALKNRHLECHRIRMPHGGFLLTCADVTQRVQTEAMVRQAQKMEAIGHLTGGLAHDFNNLLQIIRANLDLLRREIAPDTQAARRLADATGSAERGARLTRQLLAFARRQPLEPIAVNLGRLVTEMARLLRRSLGETIETETVVAGGLWNTLVDPGELENVLLNLAVNARDAMPEGGKLTIELGNAALDDAYAAANPEVTPGQYVMLAVTDTGAGMPTAVAARAFEPFFTTKPEGKGTGLGLSMVYGFVKQSGGHVKIYSESGQGTTVRIYLPRTRETEDRAEMLVVAPAVGGSETVLVVEDDAAVRKAAIDTLNDLGYRVLEAANAEAALNILAGDRRIDLLFTDVVMPGAVGSRDLARQAQGLQPNIAVLFTSGYTENAIIHHGRLDPDVALLSKPYGKDDLARKIRQVLAQQKRGGEAAPQPDVAPVRLRLLVVEDEALILASTVDMLRDLGHAAAEATDGAGALGIVERDPDLDAALIDLGLPDMRGEDLVAELRRRRPSLGVIVTSGYTSAAMRAELRDMSELIFIGKPYSATELQRALQRLAARRPPR